MAVTNNRYKFITISLLKRLRDDRSASETAVWRLHEQNRRLDPEVV
jgi:hypothetical protein